MKKFVVVSLIVAGCLFTVGCILTGISAVAGGYSVVKAIEEDSNSIINGVMGKTQLPESIVSGEETLVFDAAAVKNLDINFGAGVLVVAEKEVNDGKIEVISTGHHRKGKYRMDGSTLCIDAFQNKHGHWKGQETDRMEIRIPKDFSFSEVEMDIGASLATVSDLTADELELELGAGQATLCRMDIQEMQAKVGAGSLQGSEMELKDLTVEISIGEYTFEGTITGDLHATCGMGTMEFLLDGKETDHNYSVECAAGNVTIGGQTMTSLSADREIDHHTDSDFELSCSMGEISVDFKE